MTTTEWDGNEREAVVEIREQIPGSRIGIIEPRGFEATDTVDTGGFLSHRVRFICTIVLY